MTTRNLIGLLLSFSAAGASACTQMSAGDDDGADDDSGGGDDDGGGGGGGWAAMPLLDDNTDPNEILYHAGNDRVTGIHYASLDEGLVVTEGAFDTSNDGGAVFGATHRAVTSIRFSGVDGGPSLLGTVDFTGVAPTSNGYIAMAYASDVIQSKDGGETFAIEKNGPADAFGIEAVLAFRQHAGGFTMVRDTGVVTTTASAAPGATAVYEDIWAPAAVPTIPDPVPADQCQVGPVSPQVPISTASVDVSTDGQLIAYTAVDDDRGAHVCISRDGGASFFPHVLDVPADAVDFAPTGVLFTSDDVGIAWWGISLYEGAQYIRRTTDGGDTWSDVAMPAAIASHGVELRAGFFAPDGQHGWLAGYDYDTSSALLLKTTDGGASWAVSGGDLAAKVSAAGGGKLWSGFALDADHIWVGGEHGVLMASDTGGS
jgi:hypothetical protein